MFLGLQRGSVTLVPYQEGWASAFATERDRLLTALGSSVLAIGHVGSTAVPGLIAKPIIDVAIGVKSLEVVEGWEDSLATLGYTAFGDREGRGEHFLAKGPDALRTHYVHVVPLGSLAWRS